MPEATIISSALLAKLAPEFIAPAKGVATRTKEKLEVKFRKGFEDYLGKQLARASTVKTIISSNAPIPLKDIYVNLLLASGRKAFRDEDFLEGVKVYRSVIFTATAGAGKSMLMRYLYIRFLEGQSERLPIFIELRDLNQHPNVKLITFIKDRVADYIDGFSEQQLKYAIEGGKVVLFLDGFDEIDHDIRKDRERELNQIAARYDNLWMFVSSRPAEGFANWEKFHVFDVQPFTKKQVEALLSKIPYDEEIKRLFNSKLAEGLYETHKEFLTNPLLTIMMLVTLEQFAEVPAKIHLFYEYAFEALFGRHDVTKGGFQRKRHTSLALDDFKRLFSYFCMITYIKKSISFSADAVLGYIHQSIASSQIVVDKSLFRSDLTESTCMLVLDGLDYTFSHRSFQEYFAAYFLARVKVDEIARVVPKLVEINGGFDSVLKMLSEMNNEKFEEAWSLPTLSQMCEETMHLDANTNPLAFCRVLLGNPVLHIDGAHLIRFTARSQADSWHQERYALYTIYDLFGQIQSKLKRVDQGEAFIQKVKAGTLLKGDKRFDAVRNSPRDTRKGGEIVTEIELVDADSVWFRDLYFGNFLSLEAKLLPELRNAVQVRVEARKKGLAAIFG